MSLTTDTIAAMVQTFSNHKDPSQAMTNADGLAILRLLVELSAGNGTVTSVSAGTTGFGIENPETTPTLIAEFLDSNRVLYANNAGAITAGNGLLFDQVENELTIAGAIRTGAPDGGTAAEIKIGGVVIATGTLTLDPGNYILAESGGNLVKIGLVIES